MAKPFETITSFQNPKIKLVRKLRDKRERDQSGLFLIDYDRDMQRALTCGYTVEFILYCPELAEAALPVLLKSGGTIYTVSAEMLQKAGYRENPSGIVAVLRQRPPHRVHDLDQIHTSSILGLVNLQKPGNIGALMRSADAAGFGAIFLIDCTLDIFNPNLIRSSTGACFLNNIFTLTSTEARTYFQAAGYAVFAATPEGSVDLFSADFRDKTALILGTEDQGLDTYWMDNCDQRVKIPMQGVISDSLNVSVSGAILMYEVYRQHRERLFSKDNARL